MLKIRYKKYRTDPDRTQIRHNLGVKTRVTMTSIKLNKCYSKRKLREYSSRAFAQFRASTIQFHPTEFRHVNANLPKDFTCARNTVSLAASSRLLCRNREYP